MKAAPDKRPKSGSKPFQPSIGTDFPLSEVPSIEAKTRDFLARAVTVFLGLALAISGLYGLASGNFVPVGAVWAVGGPIVVGIVAYYFGHQRKDSG